jgi:hypothetical protein
MTVVLAPFSANVVRSRSSALLLAVKDALKGLQRAL